jgi:uncharacterized protein (DUF983 family)
MTSETRAYIEPQDILGVEFECGRCRTRLFYELPAKPVRVVHQCPNCNEPFYGPTRAEDFQAFFALLTGIRRLTEGSNVKLKLQVASPKQPSASGKSEPER